MNNGLLVYTLQSPAGLCHQIVWVLILASASLRPISKFPFPQLYKGTVIVALQCFTVSIQVERMILIAVSSMEVNVRQVLVE